MATSSDALDQRPLKRARHQQDEMPLTGQVIDHIFIADGVSAKKAGVKKTPLSCCECRRLKLKCDRNFPCASCRKRGCAEICPEGVLVSGKGTRFILANTEQLHGKIHEMSERIRLLEDALGNVHRKHEGHIRKCVGHGPYRIQPLPEDDEEDQSPPHPLLKPELTNIKSTMGLYTGGGAGPSSTGGKQEGSSGQRTNGHPMDVDLPSDRERASSEDSVAVTEGHSLDQRTAKNGTSKTSCSHNTLAAQVSRFSNAFPVSSPLLAYSVDSDFQGSRPRRKDDYKNLALREFIRGQLPHREEATYLWDQAKKNALWQYNPHSSPTFFPTLINHVYTSSIAELCMRKLALLLMILAVGCHVDLNERPRANGQPGGIEQKTQLAELYHQLGRASLAEIPIMEETNVDVILALFWETWYLLVFSDKKKAAGYAWGIMGLTVKLAQSIGLHRDSGKVKVIPEEDDKRRTLFWELFCLDSRLSLSLGRPPSLSLAHVDCQRPSYVPDEEEAGSEGLHHYQEWNHSFYIYCLSPVLDAISQPTSLEYPTVLELDRRVRDFPIPDVLRGRTGQESRGLLMQKGALSTALEAALLQLHRTFFIRAVSGFDEAFNRQHRYAPSVVAVFLSSARMIAGVQELYKWAPQATSRILGFWSNAFSSVVALSLLVCRAPFTCLTPAALQELERARILFRTAKGECPRALQVLPIMESMIDKANDIYNRWLSGQEIPTMILRHTSDDSKPGSQLNSSHQSPNRKNYQQQEAVDPFVPAHSSLNQCIMEVHERAKIHFPLRKPCMCSASVAKHCPPSHSWAPPPDVSVDQPVLPPEAPALHPNGLYGGSTNSYPNSLFYRQGQQQYGRFPSAWSEGLYSRNVLPDGPALPLPSPISSTLSPASKMAVVDSLNFDLGAINASSEQHWMAFF